ncbi:hypothetical protein H6P81_000797 [Aristolochia fimbriata]|uniref:Ubiquitin-like domain-containing protein n=1 Tax=Aristolochia fimbriata TaxID=158543 RepID=A0AAV7F6J5_ARIFI|nr:hypothetical protein H6P81_000797 [Aristolochia fimbriata]
MESPRAYQIFISSSVLETPSRALTVSPNIDLRCLKRAFFFPLRLPSGTLDSFFFSFAGKPLQDSSTLLNSGIGPLSTLTLVPKLLGGGGDGGATGAESRDCYLNMYAEKKPDKVDPNETRLSKWTTCALTSEPLNPPCVLDKLGNIFNKQPLVEALIAKKLPKEFGHIKGLKDMISIQLSVIPGKDSDDNVNYGTRFHCPITGLEFNGKYKFFSLKGCGHVLSVKALKEVKSSACLVCHREFSDSDKMVINGDADEVAELRTKLEDERGKLRDKKEKKSKSGLDEKMALSGEKRNEKNGLTDGAKEGSAKRFKAVDMAPANATKAVYASIFTSSKKSNFKETYSCRSLPLGRN